jgi:hypothetical protein
MNSQLDEEYGAGFEGTKALLYKYIKDTPGQSIQQYMKTKSLSEILKKSDPVGDWIRDFIDSDNSRFAGKSKKERINMALGAYYAAQRNESIEEGNAATYKYDTVISKLKDGSWDTSYDVKRGKHLEVTDTATKKRLTIFVEEQTKTGDKKMTYTAQVRQANKEDRAKRAAAWRKVFSNLRKEEDELEESISEEKLSQSQISILRQEYSKISKVDPSGEGYKKLTALLDKLDKQSLQDLVDAKIKFVSSLALNRIRQNEEDKLEESISKEAAVKVSASQINRYIDTENWKAIADLMKFLTPEEHELWAKNGYEGRTYELMMKSRKKIHNESTQLDEELKLFESENEEQLNEELFTTLAGYYLALKLLPLAAAALLIAAGGATAAIAYAIKGGIELKNAIERAKRDANASQKSKDMIAKLEKFNERLKAQTKKNPKKVSLIKKAADALYNKVKKKTEAEIAAKKEKTAAKKESIELDEMRELYAVVDTTDGTVVATASSEDGAKRSIRSAHLPPISSEHPSKLKIVKTKKTAQVGYPIKEETEIGLDTLRLMKIVSLATGSKDTDALYEYASTSPSYSSLVELKEAFNKYIQQA